MKRISGRQIMLPSVLLLIGTYVVGMTASNAFAYSPFENMANVDTKKTKLPELVVEVRRGEVVNLSPGETDLSRASCNEGKTMVGGGYVQTLVKDSFSVLSEFMTFDGAEYEVFGHNSHPSETREFQSFAHCAHLE